MDNQLVKFWLKEPVTTKFFNLVKEHRQALVEALINDRWESDKIGLFNQIKGQINAMDLILDTDRFFAEILTKEVITNEDEDT